MIRRYIQSNVTEDLRSKMVFVSGPRQVGKTTLAKQIGGQSFPGAYAYLNWDNRNDRKMIINGALPADRKLIVFDEIHKYGKWKNYLKGEYDKNKESFSILVTGSARLDIYRKGGDSLLGRYRSYRLHPLSLGELIGHKVSQTPFTELKYERHDKDAGRLFEELHKYGGFPELFISKDDRMLRRWHLERADRLIKEDIRDIEAIRDLSALQVLVELLPERVGSQFSLNSLREDLNVSHKTISQWTDILEKFYYHFRIYPFQSTLIKSLRKEPKLYLWDWSEIKDDSTRFENVIASHLLKFCDYFQDAEGFRARLNYIRDRDQREVDFLVTVDNKPWFCVEAKNVYKNIPAPLKYFQEKLKIPYAFEVVKENGIDFVKDGVRVISASKFLTGLI